MKYVIQIFCVAINVMYAIDNYQTGNYLLACFMSGCAGACFGMALIGMFNNDKKHAA